MKTDTHFWSYLDQQFFLEWKMFQKHDVGKNKTHNSKKKLFIENRAV